VRGKFKLPGWFEILCIACGASLALFAFLALVTSVLA